MTNSNNIVTQIELHSVEGIRECFAAGLDPNAPFRGQPLICELISEYTRTPRFKDCVRVFVDFGLEFDDKALLAVLLDDASTLGLLLDRDPAAVSRGYTLRCAYTPLLEAANDLFGSFALSFLRLFPSWKNSKVNSSAASPLGPPPFSLSAR